MAALLVAERANVDRAHARTLENGGSGEGPPGPRPHDHPHCCGANFRDPDGNMIRVRCHDPAPA
jgi:predicted lactoylglutathione lyase